LQIFSQFEHPVFKMLNWEIISHRQSAWNKWVAEIAAASAGILLYRGLAVLRCHPFAMHAAGVIVISF